MGKNMITKASVLLASALGAASAYAALPTEVSEAFTAVQTDAASMGTLAWPIATGITLTIVGIGLFKKFVGKAAS